MLLVPQTRAALLQRVSSCAARSVGAAAACLTHASNSAGTNASAATALCAPRFVAAVAPRRFFALPAPVKPTESTVLAAAASNAPLVVRHGIVSRPMSWDELRTAVEKQDWAGLGRLASVQDAYNAHKERVLSEWSSMGNFVLHEVFQAKKIKEIGNGGKWFVKFRGGTEALDGNARDADPCVTPSATPPATTNGSSCGNNNHNGSPILPPALPFLFRWTANSFPYGAEEGVHHDLLWLSQGHQVDEHMLQAEVERRLPSSQYDTIYFVNPIYNRSIKDVFHAHVFWRHKKNAQSASTTPPSGGASATTADKGPSDVTQFGPPLSDRNAAPRGTSQRQPADEPDAGKLQNA
jgi:hypothetical protein